MHNQIHHPIPGRRPAPPKRNWTPWLIVGGSLTVGVATFMAIIGALLVLYLSSGRIPSGVSVAGVTIGGQSSSAAEADLQALVNRSITLTDGDRSWQLSLADLGVSLDMAATLDTAAKAAPGTALQPRYAINLSQAQIGLVSISTQANIAAVPGTPPQQGRAMDIPVTLDRLRVDVNGEVADGVLNLDMVAVDPPAPDPDAPYSGQTTTYTVQPGQELGLIAKEYGVDIQDIVRLNNLTNPDLLYIGQELIIPSAGVYQPTQADAPAPPTTSGKSIVVSTERQRIFAYENGQLVRSHLVSTGLVNTPTVKGDYSVYVKYQADDMAGPGYFLPQVPYTMYFYKGYGIHGTYWHNNFGRPMSHGCVNLPTSEAQWFFDWASVGTPVRVV